MQPHTGQPAAGADRGDRVPALVGDRHEVPRHRPGPVAEHGDQREDRGGEEQPPGRGRLAGGRPLQQIGRDRLLIATCVD
jgi:hypothetical protein